MESPIPDLPQPSGAGTSLLTTLVRGVRNGVPFRVRLRRDTTKRPDSESVTAGRAWFVAAVVGGLIAAGPIATWAGAVWLRARIGSADTAAARAYAPRVAARNRREAARRMLADAARRPSMGATLEALARVLPTEAALLRAGRGSDGRLEIVIATADPDALRAAVRRDPALGGLRDTDQERVDGGMHITLRDMAS